MSRNLRTLPLCAAVLLLLLGTVAEAQEQKDTTVVNTTEIGKDIWGYHGPTPVKIYVFEGKVVRVEALPNEETPGYFQRVVKSDIMKAAVGKTVKEAAEMKYDAVSGATYSSVSVIEHIRAGLKTLLPDN